MTSVTSDVLEIVNKILELVSLSYSTFDIRIEKFVPTVAPVSQSE